MSLADDVKSMYKHTKDVYDAIELLDGTVPENKNLENLVGAFDTLPVISQIPDKPDLSQVLTKSDLDDIQAIVAAGAASEKFDLGDELKISYGDYTMPFEVVGFEPVEVEGGETMPAINLLAKYTSEIDSKYGANDSVKYSVSILHTNVITTYQNKLSSDFVNTLAKTKTQTYSHDGSTDVVYDKLFAPSMAQLGVTDTNYNNASQAAVEGPAFTAYQGSDNAKRFKQAINATGTAQSYWTRSLYSGNSNYFGVVRASGAPGGSYYSNNFRVVVACNLIGTSSDPTPVETATVTFDAQGGEPVPEAQTVVLGGVASKPADPTKDGFQFDQWMLDGQPYVFGTPVTQDITLVANWIPIYTVTFNANGGSPTPVAQQVLSGQTATQPTAPTRSNYAFKGWLLNNQAYNFSTPVTSNITLTASWNPIYTVTFNTDGGSPVPAVQHVENGQKATQPTNPSKDTCTFQQWTLNGNAYNFNTAVTGNITLVAEYECIPQWDPQNPTLEGLKTAVNNGEEIEVGVEIPDTYAGNSNPLIVAQNLNSSNNELYNGAEGVILVRKYVEPVSQAFSPSSLTRYDTSEIKQELLDTVYLENCSTELKNVISNISVPQAAYGGIIQNISGKWFLMSTIEVMSTNTKNSIEGFSWDLWKTRSGRQNPTTEPLPGRVVTDRNGTAKTWWLRTWYDNSRFYVMNSVGQPSGQLVTTQWGVLPACFIAKD